MKYYFEDIIKDESIYVQCLTKNDFATLCRECLWL